MPWEVEFSDEFEIWWETLSEDEQDKIDVAVHKLEDGGPTLGLPDTSGIVQSRHPRMRELRVQIQGNPFRILYAFDPRRTAMLLIGGDKTGRPDWYEEFVPRADKIYAQHLKEIGR